MDLNTLTGKEAVVYLPLSENGLYTMTIDFACVCIE